MRSKAPKHSANSAQGRLLRNFLAFPGYPPLQLNLAGGSAAWTNDDLPGMAHQVGVGEFRPGPINTVVIQRLAVEPGIKPFAQPITGGITDFQVQDYPP